MSDSHCNIIVVGGGGSGLAAAIEAARAGARVVVLEKGEILRGSTGMSVGSITSSQTELQARKGVVDSSDEHYADMDVLSRMRGAPDNLELRRILVDEVPATVRWLTSLGVVFFGPMLEPPHKKPRMHNVLPNSPAYIYYLSKECRRLGVQFVLNARAESLIKEGERITGVNATVGGAERSFRASMAVVLASGDYNGGGELRARLGRVNSDIEGVNTNIGDGQRMAVEAGGEILNGDVVWGPLLYFSPPRRTHPFAALPPWRALALFMRFSLEHLPPWLLRPFVMSFVTTFVTPDKDLFRQGVILVNRLGKRFTDETGSPASEVPLQPGKTAFLLMGREAMEKFTHWPHFISTAPGVAYAYLPDYKRNRKDVYYEADSLDALAGKIGIDPTGLRETIDAYNLSLEKGQLKDRSKDVKPIHEPPFCALGPVQSRIVITDGGLKVSTRHEVLRKDGSIIKGLYAVGSVGLGGLLLEGHGHHLGWAFTSGRRAGRIAATRGGNS